MHGRTHKAVTELAGGTGPNAAAASAATVAAAAAAAASTTAAATTAAAAAAGAKMRAAAAAAAAAAAGGTAAEVEVEVAEGDGGIETTSPLPMFGSYVPLGGNMSDVGGGGGGGGGSAAFASDDDDAAMLPADMPATPPLPAAKLDSSVLGDLSLDTSLDAAAASSSRSRG